MNELIEKINKYNTRTTIFTSLYAFDETKNNRGVYDSARIKQIFLEFDNPTSLSPLKKLHSYCLEKNLLHTMFFSGGGFHFYIATLFPNELKNKKGSITNSQISLADEVGLKIGINNDSDIDGHIIGNLAQLVRIPGTFNLRRKRYCIPLSKEDLETSLEEIGQKALYQRSGIYVYGEKFLDLSPYDSEPLTRAYELNIELGESERIGEDKINTKTFPPCIQNLLAKRDIKHRERFILILYFRELGLPIGDTIAVLKANLDPRVFYHCAQQERQIFWCYRRGDLAFPSCGTLKAEGLCPNQDCGGIKLYG